jgi:hypothetical protein
MLGTVEVTATTPGNRPLDIKEVIGQNRPLSHDLIELEAIVQGFMYKSRADFRPKERILLVYYRTPDGMMETLSFDDCQNLRGAIGTLVQLFSYLHECIDAKDYEKASGLLAFNLDEAFIAKLGLQTDESN